MCLHHGISIYVQIVWCLNGHISGPRVCCTTHEQIDIRGVAFPRGAPGGSCCSVEPQRTPALSLSLCLREQEGQRPSCKRRHYCHHHSRLLMGGTLYTRHAGNVSSYFLSYSPEMEYLLMVAEKKLPLCSAGLLTSNSREARNDAFLFVFNCLCGPFLVQSSSRPVWVSFSGCQF